MCAGVNACQFVSISVIIAYLGNVIVLCQLNGIWVKRDIFAVLREKKNRKSEGERNLRTRGLHLPRPPRPEQGEQNQPSSPFPVIVFHFVIINCSLLVSCSCRPIDNKMPPNVACPPLPWIWRLTDVNREANTYSHCFMIHEVICTL